MLEIVLCSVINAEVVEVELKRVFCRHYTFNRNGIILSLQISEIIVWKRIFFFCLKRKIKKYKTM